MTGNVPFGSPRRRGDRWQLRYRVAGRETSSTHDTFEELVEESYGLLVLTARGRRAQYLGGNLPVIEVARLWMRSSGHAYSTRKAEWSHLRNHIFPVFHDVSLRSVSRVAVERWARELVPGLSATTALRVVRILRTLAQFGLKRGWIETDPTTGIWISGANRRRHLELPTIEQVMDLRAAMDTRFRLAVDLGAWVGCTVGEAAAMRPGDIDFENRMVHVHALRRRDNEGRVVLGEQMKTSTRERVVPAVPEFVWGLWQELLGSDADELLVAAPRGGVLDPGNYRDRFWRPVVKEVFGDARAIVPHDLRHFAISVWLAAGATIRDAADWAGHSSPSLVEGTYSHSLPRTGSPFEDEVLASVLAGRSYPRLRVVGSDAA